MMTDNPIVIHNKSPKFVHARHGELLRLSGEWVDQKNTTEVNDSSLIHTTFSLLRSLPGWPLLDGINTNINSGGMLPDNHQLLPMDMLESGWLSMFGVNNFNGIPRTKLLISDEGGTGKTLSTCLAVRYISLKKSINGPIICLVPPLLVDHWVEHLRIVFHDEPERVERLSSASHYNKHHQNRIVVVSKWSWSKHFEHISSKLIAPLCVVIDEVHQGRTGEIIDDMPSDERISGMAGIQEQDVRIDSNTAEKISNNLRTSVRKTCINSAYTIGVSATPINLELSELNTILEDMGREEYSSLQPYKESKQYTKEIGNLMRKARKMNTCEPRCEFFKPIIERLPEVIWKAHGLEKEDIQSIKEWCQSQKEITPSVALRALRELHPYGRNLSITLREDLDKKQAENFRVRKTELLDVDKKDMEAIVWSNVITRSDSEDSVILNQELDKLRMHALVLNSHRTGLWRKNRDSNKGISNYYKGDFLHPGVNREDIVNVEDQRVVALLGKFAVEIDECEYDNNNGNRRKERIGAVIFSEWNGTIDLSGLKVDIDQIGAKYHPDKKFVVTTFRGGEGLDSLKSKMQQCRRLSMEKNKFPILITSPAGEVGIEMAWASNLVHWDIHTNPQRMEQRTWRVDRRMVDGGYVKREYRVFFPRFKGNKINQLLEEKIQPRWNDSCNELGKEESKYLANKEEPVTGMENNVQLLGLEIQKLQDHFSKERERLNQESTIEMMHKGEASGSKTYIQQRHKWKAKVGLSVVGFDEGLSDILDSGKFEIDWPKEIPLMDSNVSLVRDLELVSKSLSDSLSLMPPKDRETMSYSVHMSNNPSCSRALPLFDKLITTISPKLLNHTYSYEGTDIEALAINDEIIELHESERINETGLVFKIKTKWKQWDEFTDIEKQKHGMTLLEILGRCWSAKDIIKEKVPEEPKPIKIKHDSLDKRLLIIEEFVEQEKHKIECHRTRIEQVEDGCEDDERDWRTESINTCKERIEACQTKIKKLNSSKESPYRILLSRK